MKKIFAIFLCLAMAVSFAACNKDETPTEATGASSVATQATTAATEAQTTSATEEASSTEGTIQQETTAPSVPKETQPEPTEGATEPTAPATPEIQKLTQKEQFELLASVVGMHFFDAAEELGWSENQLIEVETCCYETPLQIYLDGTEFRVYFGISEGTHKVSEVLYKAEVPTQPLEVAKLALRTVDLLDSWVGKENQLESDGSFALRDVTEIDVSAGISLDEWAYSMISWDYSKRATATQKEFIVECGPSVAFGVYLEVSRICLTAENNAGSDTCEISFSVGVIPA